jgi:catechol 2,3-dioxygenase-like lactoylglutathione lyase family enzyme
VKGKYDEPHSPLEEVLLGRIGVLNHVILHVQDMSREVSFYRDKMGFNVLVPQGVEDFSDVHWVELDTGECALALHDGGKGDLGEDAPGLNFWVGDIEAARKALIARGIELSEIQEIVPGVYICDGRDPEGNRFSLEGKLGGTS